MSVGDAALEGGCYPKECRKRVRTDRGTSSLVGTITKEMSNEQEKAINERQGGKKRGRPGSDKWECVDCVGENEGEEARYPGDDMSCLLGATNHVFLQRRPPLAPRSRAQAAQQEGDAWSTTLAAGPIRVGGSEERAQDATNHHGCVPGSSLCLISALRMC